MISLKKIGLKPAYFARVRKDWERGLAKGLSSTFRKLTKTTRCNVLREMSLENFRPGGRGSGNEHEVEPDGIEFNT